MPPHISRAMRVGAAMMALSLSTAHPATAQSDEQDTVVARVGDQEVRVSEIVSKVFTEQQRNKDAGEFDELYAQFLEDRVSSLLVVQAALAAGLKDDPVHQQRMEQVEQQMLADLYIQREINKRVTRETMHAHYEELVASGSKEAANMGEEVKTRHLVVETEPQAQALYERIIAGEDFITIAKSLGYPGSAEGGDLGWISPGDILPEIVNPALAAEIGVVTEPVSTQFGWHLILVEDRRPIQAKPFEEVQNELFHELSLQARAQIIADLSAVTKVERFNRDGTPVAAE